MNNNLEKIVIQKIGPYRESWAVVYLDPNSSYSAGGGRIFMLQVMMRSNQDIEGWKKMKPRNVKFPMVIERPTEQLVDAYKFVSVCCIEKCRRILDRAPTQEPRKAKSYSDKTGSYYGDHNHHSVCLIKLKEAVEDFKLVAEYKLPNGFWGNDSIDVFGVEGTSLYLEAYAFYSNDEEKAILDRLQLALDRITKGL